MKNLITKNLDTNSNKRDYQGSTRLTLSFTLLICIFLFTSFCTYVYK